MSPGDLVTDGVMMRDDGMCVTRDGFDAVRLGLLLWIDPRPTPGRRNGTAGVLWGSRVEVLPASWIRRV